MLGLDVQAFDHLLVDKHEAVPRKRLAPNNYDHVSKEHSRAVEFP